MPSLRRRSAFLLASTLLAILCTLPLRAAELLEMTASSEPSVGTVTTLRWVLAGGPARETVMAVLETVPEIEVLAGDVQWRGELDPGEERGLEVVVRALEEGKWPLVVLVTGVGPQGASGRGETRFFELEARTDGGELRGLGRASSPAKGASWQSRGRLEAAEERQGSSFGTVTVTGRLSYSAFRSECSSCPRQRIVKALPRARIEVWDDTLPFGLAGDYLNERGEFSIDVPVFEADGIDPYLKVYATDNERVLVTRRLLRDNSYWERYPRARGTVGSNLTRGLIDLGHLILPASDETQALFVFDRLANKAHGFLEREVGWSPDDLLRVVWPSRCLGFLQARSCYALDHLYLSPRSAAEIPDVFVHEYAHYVHFQFLAESISLESSCWQAHGLLSRHGSPECAWIEGWADFLPLAIYNDPLSLNLDIEGGVGAFDPASNNYLPNAHEPPFHHIEIVTAAILWDLFDGGNGEPHDAVALGLDGGGIWQIATQLDQKPEDLLEFYELWVRENGLDCNVSAIFQHHLVDVPPASFSLGTRVEPQSAGTVAVSPPSSCPGDTWQEGTRVDLEAVPAPGWYFDRWSGDAGGRANPTTVLMGAARSVVAHFTDVLPIPPAPEGVSAVSAGRAVDVRWIDGGPLESGYRVRVYDAAATLLTTVDLPAETTSHTVAPVSPGIERCFQVQAFNGTGSSAWTPASPTMACAAALEIPPAAPESVTAVGTSPSSVEARWTDTSNNEDGFRVRVYDAAGTLLLTATKAAGTTSHSVSGLASGVERCFQVQSFNTAGASPWVPSSLTLACAASQSAVPPAPPSGVVAQGDGATAVRVSWSDASSNEDGFRVRLFDASGSLLDTVILGAGSTSYRVGGLGASSERCFQVQSFNTAGASIWVPSSPTFACAVPDPPAPQAPAAPTNVAAAGESSSSVRVTWSDASNNEDGFRVRVYNGSGSLLETVTLGVGATSHGVGGLGPSSRRCFQVQSFNGAGDSAWVPSSSSSACAEPLASPASITVQWPNGNEQLIKGNQYTLRWSRSGDVPRVGVYLYKNGAYLRDIAPAPSNCTGVDADAVDWYVPFDVDDGFGYQIKVERLPDVACGGSEDVVDLSDATFQICEQGNPGCAQ